MLRLSWLIWKSSPAYQNTLAGAYMVMSKTCFTRACCPTPSTVAGWRSLYLDVWDNGIDGLDPDPEYKRKRREVIIETFDRIERLARKCHDE